MGKEPSSAASSDLRSVSPPLEQDADELIPKVYEELRRLARSKLARLAPGQTLQPTDLVNEVYMRLLGKPAGGWQDIRQFFFAAARAMHDILVERARAKATVKRGGGRVRLDLDSLIIPHEAPSDEILALSEALRELERRDARKHQLVMLRFFAGCSTDQAASAMDLSRSAVQRDWRYARAWLHRRLSEISDGQRGGDGS